VWPRSRRAQTRPSPSAEAASRSATTRTSPSTPLRVPEAWRWCSEPVGDGVIGRLVSRETALAVWDHFPLLGAHGIRHRGTLADGPFGATRLLSFTTEVSWSGRLGLNQRPPGPEKATGTLCCWPLRLVLRRFASCSLVFGSNWTQVGHKFFGTGPSGLAQSTSVRPYFRGGRLMNVPM
jgi:hypothetical protein